MLSASAKKWLKPKVWKHKILLTTDKSMFIECGPPRAGDSGERSSSNPGRMPPESQQPWERSGEIPRSKEHRSNRGSKRQTEA